MVKFLEDFCLRFWANRQVHPILQRLLNYDEFLTQKILVACAKIDGRNINKLFRLLEISVSFPLWLLFWSTYAFFLMGKVTILHRNLLIGTFLDIGITTFLKLVTARKRPKSTKKVGLGVVGLEIFSFPSGHTSRCTYLVYFFTFLAPVNAIFTIILIFWLFMLAMSRILLQRHFLFDILGGFLTGLSVGVIIGFIWDINFFEVL